MRLEPLWSPAEPPGTRIAQLLAKLHELHSAEWRGLAACANVPNPDVFFPSNTRSAEAKARAHCAGCPVMAPCLREGFEVDDGVFGGLTARERRRIRNETDDPAARLLRGLALAVLRTTPPAPVVHRPRRRRAA